MLTRAKAYSRAAAAMTIVFMTAAPGQAQASDTVIKFPAKEAVSGFAPISRYHFRAPQDVAASRPLATPTDGTVYFGGVTDDNKFSLLHVRRTGTVVHSAQVPLPSLTPSSRSDVRLAVSGKTVYVMFTDTEERGTCLFRLSDNTLDEIDLPHVGPNASPLYITSLAADPSGRLWVAGYNASAFGQPPALDAFYSDTTGSNWSDPLVTGRPWDEPRGIYAVDNHLFLNIQGSQPRSARGAELTGTEWQDRGPSWLHADRPGALLSWTFEDSRTMTRWGAESVNPAIFNSDIVAMRGACQDQGEVTSSTRCIAPAWPVSAVARLSDGRIVLGGSDYKAAEPAGFAVASATGRVPVHLNGDNGQFVQAISAPVGGGLVWAATIDNEEVSLQAWDPDTQNHTRRAAR